MRWAHGVLATGPQVESPHFSYLNQHWLETYYLASLISDAKATVGCRLQSPLPSAPRSGRQTRRRNANTTESKRWAGPLNGKKCKYHWKQEVSRSTKWDTARQRSLTQRWKHGCYQARTWHGGNTRANEWVGEAKLTRLHTAWCQSHEILQKTKPCRQQRIGDSRQQICDCQRGRRRRRGDVEFEISRRKLSHKDEWQGCCTARGRIFNILG